ncbi:MAG: Ig-like domain-containing protein [Deltaproteobacteria bacterium]|nr:Ig-like domain-containing protein [Deltaproteobacteria bacterium]
MKKSAAIQVTLFIWFLLIILTGCGGDVNSSDSSGSAAVPVPTGLTVTAASYSQIDLSWTASDGATGYKIYRGGTYLKSVTTTSTSDTELTASTNYCYSVSAYNSEGNDSAQTSQRCATTNNPPPPVPTGLTVTAATSSQINLSWTASAGAAGYKVYKNGAYLKSVTATATSASDTGLTASTVYCYSVSAYDSENNESAQTSQLCATTYGPPPPVPTGVTAGAISPTKVDLSWTASSGAAEYRIYRNGVLLGTSIETYFSDTTAAANTAYTYRIAAVDATGSESGQSTQASANTGLTVPAAVTVTVNSKTQITVSWTNSGGTNVTGYKLYRNGVLQKPVTTTFFADTGLTPDTQYCYSVSSTDASGNESAKSSQICVTTTNAAPPVPTELTVTAATSSQINLSWTASVGAAGYKVYRDGTYLRSVTTTSASDTTLAASTAYCYSVSAYDLANNESAQTSQLCATTYGPPPPVPTGVTASAVSPTQVDLSWTASSGAAAYRIYRDGVLLGTSTAAYFSDTTAAPNTAYTYTVTAVDATGSESSQSAQSSADTGLTVPANVTAIVDSATQISLSWNAATGATGGYKVYRNGALLGSVNTTSLVDGGLDANTQYCYSVSSVNSVGAESAKSSQLCVATMSPPTAATLDLSAVPTTVKSDNSTISTITVMALNAQNAVLPDVTVTMATDEGILGAATVTTDDTGKATLTFRSGANPINRTATITAKAGSVSAQIPVQIVGSTVEMTSNKTNLPADGSTSATVTVTAKNAGGIAVSGAAVTLTQTGAEGGSLNISPATGTTNGNGIFTATITGANAGLVTLTAEALGAKATKDITINPSTEAFGIDQQRLNGTDIGNPNPTAMRIGDELVVRVNAPGGITNITFATTTGNWNGGGKVVTVAVIDGKAEAALTTVQAGMATVQVYDPAEPGTVDTLSVAMISVNPASISIQATPTVIPRSVGTTTGSSTVIATVRDINGFPVGGAPVLFEIVNPTGGGETISPVVVMSAATTSGGLNLGEARATFTSGSLSSDTSGVEIRASVVGTGIATSPNAKVVIGGTAGSVAFGKATVVGVNENATQYILPMSILVSDSNGNPAPAGTQVSLSAWPEAWSTGEDCAYHIDLNADTALLDQDWISGNDDDDDGIPGTDPFVSFGTFWSEDANENLVLDPGEDGKRHYYADSTRINPAYEASMPGTIDGFITPTNASGGVVPATVTTDANGVANFDLTYPKHCAIWTITRIRASTIVMGSETVGQTLFRLPPLSSDVTPVCRLQNPHQY